MESTIVAEEKSTHKVNTFVLGPLTKVEDADTLSYVKISDTDYCYVGKTLDWQDKVGTVVAYVPPDSLVDTLREEFNFLIPEAKYDENGDKGNQFARIKAKKLRQVLSYGLLVPTPQFNAGENVAEQLNVKHYEPKMNTGGKNATMSGEVAKSPSGHFPKYDVDAFPAYGRKVFVEGEAVILVEKLHGCSSKYVYKDDEMHVSSRGLWKKEWTSPPNLNLEDLIKKVGDEEKAKAIYDKAVTNHQPKKDLWWTVLDEVPAIKTFCQANPGYCLYGEVYGQIQKGFDYGIPNGKVSFAAFDILTPDGIWMNYDDMVEMCRQYDVPTCPLIAREVFNYENMLKYAEGNTTLPAKHIREGCVIRPVNERWDVRLGRAVLKIINPEYLS